MADDIQRIVNKAIGDRKEGLDPILRKITLTLWTQLVKYTPADTGRARAGWLVSRNTPTTEKPSEGLYSDRRPAPVRNIRATPPTAVKPGFIGAYWIVNNVEYISVLDEGRSPRDGQVRGSKQAPRGMTRLAIQDLKTAFRIR